MSPGPVVEAAEPETEPLVLTSEEPKKNSEPQVSQLILLHVSKFLSLSYISKEKSVIIWFSVFLIYSFYLCVFWQNDEVVVEDVKEDEKEDDDEDDDDDDDEKEDGAQGYLFYCYFLFYTLCSIMGFQ